MTQRRIHSLVESLANVAIGYAIAIASQLIIFPAFGIHVSLADNLIIGGYFTLISIARSYAVRRFFNRI